MQISICLLDEDGMYVDEVDYILICSDRAARGVDFEEAAVDHVIHFHSPKDPAEYKYVHRVASDVRHEPDELVHG
jgi:superfamily II DNA/RNA helicase